MLKKLLSALGLITILLVGEIGGNIGKIIGKAAFAPSKPNEQQVEKKLIEGLTIAANQLNQQLPMMVDEYTRLDRATVGPGASSVYHYTFPKITSKEIDSNWLHTNLRPAITMKVCSSKEMEMSLRYGAIYVYSYSGSDGIEITRFEIDRNACGSGAPMQAIPSTPYSHETNNEPQNKPPLPRKIIRPKPDETVQTIQSYLSELNYYNLTPNGIADVKTKDAIKAFQRDQKLPVSGIANETLLHHLLIAFERANEPDKPDLSRASPDEQRAIEQACDTEREAMAKEFYYECLSNELVKLGYH
jgi:hypothetical protein